MGLSDDQLKIPFVNLRTMTHYSLQLAIGTPEEHLAAASAAGHSGIAITDNGTMAGIIQMLKESKKKKFPCVLGVNLFVTEDINTRDPEHRYDRLVVFIKTWEGYQNLCKLISISSLEDHFYYRPRVSYQELFDHKKGLIVSASDITSPFGYSILNGDKKEEELFKRFKDEFADDFYAEISLANVSKRWSKDLKNFVPEENKQEVVNHRIMELSKKYGVTPYLAMPSYMPDKSQYTIQKIVISGSPTGKDGWHFPEPQYTMTLKDLYNRKEVIAPYLSDEEFVQLCKNTTLILDKAKSFKPKFRPLLLKVNYEEHPLFHDTELENKLILMEKYFSKIDPAFANLLKLSRGNENIKKASEALPMLRSRLDPMIECRALRLVLKIIFYHKKVDLQDPVVRDRIVKELDVIERNGVVRFCDYALPLEEVVRLHRRENEERGFGRGSGGSSIIFYAMDISDVDPLKYNLDFDRFCTTIRLGRFSFV